MNYRQAILLPEEDMTSAGTKTLSLNVRDIISRLTITWRVTMAGYGMNAFCYEDISKIELVDGSDVLFSMTGGEAQALNIFDRRVPTMNHGQYVNGSSVFSTYGIDFGRFLNDPVLALDPSRFRNLQLKITYSPIIMDTGASHGYLAVYADLFDEKVATPVGFLMSKEHKSYTIGSANSYEYTDLPTDHPMRKMLVKAYKDATEPWAVISEVRLDEDNEKRIPFTWATEAYCRMMTGVWAAVEEQFYGRGDDADGYVYYITPTNYFATIIGSILGGVVEGFSTGVTPGGKVTLHATTDGNFLGMARGYLPNHCIEFPFGDPKDIEDWYDVTKLGSLRARTQAGSGAATTGAIVLQQLRRY